MKIHCKTYKAINVTDKLIIIFIATIILFPKKLKAQPYLDILHIKNVASPGAGLFNQKKNDVKLGYFAAGTNLPIRFKNKKDAIIFSPFYERWSSQISNMPAENYYGIGLPVTLSKMIPHSRWRFLLTGIIRMNDSSIDKNGKIQVGGACMLGYKKNEKVTYKLGVYINDDLFGLFVIPLIGIDWKISNRDNLFGALPGFLTYEHKLNDYFYYGACFRAITNSYAKTQGYWRIDENQLGLYLDTYLTKNILFNIEAGHSILRKIRTGEKNISKYDAGVNDGLYFKVSLAYRIRL
jgi:hypothetical protein